VKLKVQQVIDAFMALASIVASGKPMPQKGKYRLARLHAKLRPEFETANAARDDLIKSYGWKNEAGVDAVPIEQADDFAAKWKEIADQEIEVEVQPVPLVQLDMGDNTDGPLSVQQLIALGDLVIEA
jgi:hypothetical protein